MTIQEISQASQASYRAHMQALWAAGITCDDDLSPEERKEREEFDADRSGYNRGSSYRRVR